MFAGAALLAPAKSQNRTLPAPIWSGRGTPPAQYANRKVFLSPDEHSVFILCPNSHGTGTEVRQFPLHNRISIGLRTQITHASEGFRYSYELENEKSSVDAVTTFSIVVYPDPNIRAAASLWRGGVSTAIVGDQVALPGAPSGELALWLCPKAQPLLPGSSTQFSFLSEAKPGFTTAAAEHYPHVGVSEDWPRQILDELDPVLDPHWIDNYVISLGPRYAPAERPERMASDYIAGIQDLIRTGRLDTDSGFVKDLLGGLQAIVLHSTTAPLILMAAPQSEIEIEIANALGLSIGTIVRPAH